MKEEHENMNKEEQMLSTLDNPYNPFHHFDLWNQFDQAKGYYTLSYLGRMVDYSHCVNDEQRRKARELAINTIVSEDPSQMYCKVSRNEEVKPIVLESLTEN